MYDFSQYMAREAEQTYLQLKPLKEDDALKAFKETEKENYIKLITAQHDIGDNRKNVDRKYHKMLQEKLQKHEEESKRRSICKKL